MIVGHGDDLYHYQGGIRANFSSNVFQGMEVPGLKEHLCQSLNVVGHYPEPDAGRLAVRIAELNGVDPEEVLVTNGATEAIYLIARCAGEKAFSQVMIPTFSEYEDACRLSDHRLSFFQQINEIDSADGWVWICNPNNPTGQVLPPDALVSLMEAQPQHLFVFDQSYESLSSTSVLSIKSGVSYPNCIQIHSLTKEFAIPGLRLGYLTACRSLIQSVRRFKHPWSVNALAIEAGLYLLGSTVQFDVPSYMKETQWLRSEIDSIHGVEAFPTSTNFFLLRFEHPCASDLKSFLVRRGILIRNASNFRGLNGHYVRVATQNHAENVELIKGITAFLNQASWK